MREDKMEKKENMSSALKRAQETLFFNETTIQKIAKDVHAGRYATIILICTIILTQLIVYIPTKGMDVVAVGLGMIYAVVIFIALTSATHLCAKYLFHGKGMSNELYRVAGHSYVVNIFLIIPVLGGLIAYIWYMLALIKNVSIVYRIDKVKSTGAVLIPVCVFILALLLFIFAVAKQMLPLTAVVSIP